ncbi:MAG: hypothetical protein H7246_19300 [Phycisphaerae bacterium]|nr:hypothetical protein [Saprospiraceae bacterium]
MRSPLIPIGLALISALLRFLAFTQTPFANGWDSYFYLVQIKSLEETGHMHSPEASLIYPYLRLFYWLVGDYVLALKIGTAVLCGVFMLVLCRRSQSLPLLGAWSLFSPQLTYFAAQYPKNLLGLVLFVAFVRSLDWTFTKPRAWLAIPAFLLIINCFGHRMMFGLAVVHLFLWLGFRFKERLPRRAWCFHQAHVKQDAQSKHPLRRLHLVKTPSAAAKAWKILLVSGIAIGALLLAGQSFPGLAHITDLGRLSGTFDWQPQFAPWSFVQSFGLERISGWWIFEISMVMVWWIGGLILWKNRNGIANPALFWLCGLLLFPFLEWSLTGLAWRMFLVFVLLVPLAFDFQNVSKKASIAFFMALVAASFFSWKSYSPRLHDPDYALFKKVTGKVQSQLPDPDSFGTKLSGSSIQNKPELFIAHNALAEYFTFTTGTDAMPWLPEYAVDSSKLWRIAAGVQGQTLRYFAGPENELKIKNLGGGYFLLPEFVWQNALKNALAEGDEYFLETAESWLNPYRIRPAFLLKRKQ